MSLLCSCGGRRRKKKKTGDNSDYYSRTPTPSIAPTPKVKRKFPEGVVSLPSVPSDLEEAVGQLPTVSLGHRDSPPQEDEHLLVVSQQETVHHEGSSQEPVVSAILQVTLKTKDSPPQSSEVEDTIEKNEERPLSICAETQCDFADFDDDLLCFQEEEEYLSQVSDIQSKAPSVWDDTSSLKSSELFDVIQGEVEHFPKKTPSTDEVWKDIKHTLLTLINDKDSDLVQELRTPLEEIPCPSFKAPPRDVDVICKHIDDYFAAQEKPMDCANVEPQLRDEASGGEPNESAQQEALVDKSVHFDLEEAPLRLHKNNIGNRLYDNFQMHVGILMPEAKPKSTLSRHTKVHYENSPATSTDSVNDLPRMQADYQLSYEDMKKLNEEIPHNNTEQHWYAYNDTVSSKAPPNECDMKLMQTNKNESTIMNGSALNEHFDEKRRDHPNSLEDITSNNQAKELNDDTVLCDDEALNKEIEEFLEVDVICPITLEEDIPEKSMAQLIESDMIEPNFLDDEALNKEVNEFLEVKIPSILYGDTPHDSVDQLLEIDSKAEASILDEVLNNKINECLEVDKVSSAELDVGLSGENANHLPGVKDINTNLLNEDNLNNKKKSLGQLQSGNLDSLTLNKDTKELLGDNEENSLTVMENEDFCRAGDSNFSGQSNFHNKSLDKVASNPFEDKWLDSPFSFDYKFLDSPSQFNKFQSQAVSDSAALLQAIHALADGVEDLSFCGNTSTNDSNSSREDSVLHNNMGRFFDIPTPLDSENEEESRIEDMTLYKGVNTSAENEEGVQEESKPALDLAQNSNVQDAFVIAVEQQARERLERLSALKRIKPVDMTKLSQQLNQQIPATEQQQELNGFIESSPIYVTSIPPSSVEPPPTARRRGGAGVAVKVTPGAGAGGTSTTNGHASSVEEPDSAAEIELKQELEEEEPAAEPLPSGSPFANGRTEVLIGQDEAAGRLRTTAIVETSDERPRRRSGSNIVVVEAGGAQDKPVSDDDMMMMTLDNGPHREMAVDVPDSFIARSKTPPRYPPPRPQTRLPTTTTSPPSLNGSVTAPKPVPPPRDHLRIERDGRLVNRAPAPQVPARTVINNNNNNNNTEREPTKEQLDSIRKFQEALRKRKEEEERVAQQNEFLNRSLRGSRKLQALESHPPPTGVINDGYSSADEEQQRHRETLRTVIGYGELVASLQRLQLQLKKSSLGQGGYSSLEGQLAAVQTLLLSPQFGRALAVHNKVQQVWNGRVPPPASSHAQNLVRDCLDALQPCSLADAAELADLLTRYEIEGLLHAHDAIAAASAASGITMGSPLEEETPAQLPGGENIRIIKIEKTNEPLGATVRNEGDAVIIGRIVRGGAAEKSGLLHEGDEVLEVNGIEMRGKSVNEVCDILSGMTGTLTFLIVPKSAARPALPSTRDTLLHMKAHFDYDPEEDLYIPCRELGISFQKGDVLHVISQEDPNWWQAYREGEEDQTLAGLIPSRSFQHQRESMKQTIAGDKLTREKTKKAGTLLCAKKNPKKKKKKLPYNDGGYPLYATSTIDDYDADEILTYEEVALYYPRANHKRPIVLIGPSNIGRHELRQRLMEDAERFAAAIPHTSRARKEGEVDGQDYHFISRAQFESDILARKFVEHGEYEKAYYGTSLDAIRSVVNSGKICVLNLHPQSLKILRGSDLKPYVVFVAPPSLEKLRQKKIRSGEAYKEDELKDIIEKAREMEDKYDHYFDKVIVNSDTDRAYHQLLNEINALEREPQWVPASWVKAA